MVRLKEMIKEIESENSDLQSLSERLLNLKQFYNDIAYCLTNYHLESFKKQIKNINNLIKEKQTLEKKQFNFDSKFKFKTLHLNQQKTQKKSEEIHIQEEKEKFTEEEIDCLSDQKNQTIVLNAENIKDHYKLKNFENCTVSIDKKLKILYLENIKNCTIYTGVVESSIFGDNIHHSVLQCIAQQIRIHKTKDTQFYIYVTSTMIIEDSTGISIKELKITEKHQNLFKDSVLKERENNWKEIKDFNWIKKTPSPNFTIVTEQFIYFYESTGI